MRGGPRGRRRPCRRRCHPSIHRRRCAPAPSLTGAPNAEVLPPKRAARPARRWPCFVLVQHEKKHNKVILGACAATSARRPCAAAAAIHPSIIAAALRASTFLEGRPTEVPPKRAARPARRWPCFVLVQHEHAVARCSRTHWSPWPLLPLGTEICRSCEKYWCDAPVLIFRT